GELVDDRVRVLDGRRPRAPQGPGRQPPPQMALAADLAADAVQPRRQLQAVLPDLLQDPRGLRHGALGRHVQLGLHLPVADGDERPDQWFDVGVAVAGGGVAVPAGAGTRRGTRHSLHPPGPRLSGYRMPGRQWPGLLYSGAFSWPHPVLYVAVP